MMDSKKLNAFFDRGFNDSAKQAAFWDFVHETPLYHTLISADMDPMKSFDHGFFLATAAKNRPILFYENSDFTLFFIGSVEEVLKDLEDKYNMWEMKFPKPPTEEEFLQNKIQQAELDAKKAKQKLKRLQKKAK